MRLIDRIIQCRTPFIVVNNTTGQHTHLSGAMDAAEGLQRCPIRYVLDDDLTTLCTDLAYSKGATVMSCADLMRVPAENIWLEWCDQPWATALDRNGLSLPADNPPSRGRHGMFICASSDGRRGLIRSYWSLGDADADLHASAAQARFHLDADEPECPATDAASMRVFAHAMDPEGVLSRCFHFEFEPTWGKYYQEVAPSQLAQQRILHHSIGCVALAIPVLLAFLLLLATRAGLPQRVAPLERLNKARARLGRVPLANHIEVGAPILPEYRALQAEGASGVRRAPRLHHVRGHLVRRNDRLFWRVPHVRGKSGAGYLKSRTVVWRFDAAQRRERSSRGSTP
ncbi:MAG TPA: hypothetical protein VGD63_04030 [Steroidobacteraceae bacterium]